MDVLITGAYGRCGTALLNRFRDRSDYSITCFDRSPPEDGHEAADSTIRGDITDYEALVAAAEGHDALVHLAGCPHAGADWETVFEPNYIGTYRAFEASREAEMESVVFASSNHAVGMYETEHAPEIYEPDHPVLVDHRSPVRPDGHYGMSKVFGEGLGRYYVENHDYPEQVYAHRIGYVLQPEYDHPYGAAKLSVDRGDIKRGSEEYDRRVRYGKAIWFSRRDYADMTDAMLQDDSVDYGIFNGVSDNDRRWFDLEHVRSVLGFRPADNGERWDAPPDR